MTDDLELNGTTRQVLFRLDASIRVEGSHSREIADIVEQEWRNAHPTQPVLRRHVGVDPIAPLPTTGPRAASGRLDPARSQ
jgi:FMN-dependent NADH-azoreductase